ncbi:MAG: HAD family hydrolase [Oscillospiraceae bacterium]|nr:HAD family hydrolase [Oscillospiraceae bacterium]
MNKPKMILFDYGGTLLYEPNLNPDAGNKAIFPYISENPQNISLDEFNSFLRGTFDKIRKLNSGLLEIHEHIFLRYVLEYFDMKLSIPIEEAEWIICNAISDAQKTPHVEEMLSSLQSMGIRTGVISNLCWSGNALTKRLHEHFPNHQFEFILTSSEYIFRKPEKLIFDLAVRKSGLNPDEVWYCGNDIAVDIYGAHHAGLFPVFYDDRSIPSTLHEKNGSISMSFPYLRISSWKELTSYLINLNRI